MLECIVFCSGALVMILEMVGARVMAPHVGTSTIVWASLIGVVLACLAWGAWMGGRLADRKLSRNILAAILAGTGVGCGLTALAHPLVGEYATRWLPDLRLAAVAAAVCLFGLPATLFGMITPYVIRLRLADLATSGATVGRLYALSTAGSILGTFLGGFVLISWLPSTQILLGTGAAMLGLSLLASLKKPLLRCLLLICCGAGLWASQSYDAWQAARGLPPLVETRYNSVTLQEGLTASGRRVRLMGTDPGYMQSGMYLDSPAELHFEYTRFYALGPALVPDATRVLMLGGGGYSVPKWLLAGYGGLDGTRLRLDVVELDPGMTEISRRYFGLKDDPRLRIFHEDARRFCNTNEQQYDLVLVDVFNSHYSVPFQVGTVEAAHALRRAVAPGGLLLMNVISGLEGETGALLRAIHGAMRTAFPEVHLFAVGDKDALNEVQNFILLAAPELTPRMREILAGDGPRLSGSLRDMLAARVTSPVPGGTPPLTDELAPVERYTQVLLR